MPHAAGPDCAQHARLRVALHRVKHIAWKSRHKAARRGGDDSGPQADKRLCGTLARDHGIDLRENAAAVGAQHEAGFRHRTTSSRKEATPEPEGAGDKDRVNGVAERSAPERQTGVRGLRIACRTISVSLKGAGYGPARDAKS